MYSIVPPDDGGYIGAGETYSGPLKSGRGWAIKLDANGVELWSESLEASGTFESHFNSIAPTGDGGFVAVGYAITPEWHDLGWAVKLDANGNEVWNRTFEGSAENLDSIAPTSDGGYITVGVIWSPTEYDGAIIKLDGDGNQLWYKTVATSGSDTPMSVAVVSDGSYVIAGYIYENYSYSARAFKLDANGNLVWNKTFQETVSDVLWSVAVTRDGGYVAVGQAWHGNEPRGAGWVLKLDANGNKLWDVKLGQITGFLKSVAATDDGGSIITGCAGGCAYKEPIQEGWVIKLDGSGKQVWSKIINSGNAQELESVSPTRDGGYIAAGWMGAYDGWVVKLDANGNTGSTP